MAEKNFMRKYQQTISNEICKSLHVAQRCKITKVNSDKTFDIQPLALYSDGTKRSKLINVPALFTPLKIKYDDNGKESYASLIADYQVGDIVEVVFDDRDTANFSGSKSYALTSSRMHNLNDAIIIGKIYDGKWEQNGD
ncbi:hypothetical protein [Lactobacillus acetotolerans]|uniref:hypothetical protein n=1 Tax=Lactobacillus acetotolerans TaxID=1600 RepID=UPI002FDAF7BE